MLYSLINNNVYYIFARTIGSYEYYIKVFLKKELKLVTDGEIVLKTIKYKTEHMQIIKKEKKLIDKFITLDIETMVVNGVHIPYNICFYDGVQS
jgi:protein associated with RNAse G/E